MSVNVILIIPVHKGKYTKEITEFDFNTENRWAGKFVKCITGSDHLQHDAEEGIKYLFKALAELANEMTLEF